MLAIREVQDATGGFMTFIPLFCHYENTEMQNYEELTGFDIIKNYAISRLRLDNIPHIKAFWIQIGSEISSKRRYHFGTDDLDGNCYRGKNNSFGRRKKTAQALSKDELIVIL
ncbi:MAG: hypothetical protein M0C28_39800 [Candidatus Moduliflexus flocculans]|nr:hypothetical protein [Candidatus Moduliflexus flocculans]